jgi:hypothetical protein
MYGKSTAKTPAQYFTEPAHGNRKADLKALHDIVRKYAPKLKPSMQHGMVGYGTYHYKYASGREGDWPIIAIANQKNYISLYACMVDGKQYVAEKYKKQLPKANIGKSCIRFKRLSDLDLTALGKLLQETEKIAIKEGHA